MCKKNTKIHAKESRERGLHLQFIPMATLFTETIPGCLRRSTEWLYEQAIVTLSVLSTVILLVCDLEHEGPMQYAVIPLALMAIAICFILGARFLLFLWDHGVFAWLWTRIVLAYTTSRFYFVAGIEILNEWKFGRYLWTLAGINLLWIPYWFYHNIDLFKIVKTIGRLIVDLVYYFTDPKAIIASFFDLLKFLRLYGIFMRLRTGYMTDMWNFTQQGSVAVIVTVCLATLLLFFVGAILPYLCRHGRDAGERFVLASRDYLANSDTVPSTGRGARTSQTHAAGDDTDSD